MVVVASTRQRRTKGGMSILRVTRGGVYPTQIIGADAEGKNKAAVGDDAAVDAPSSAPGKNVGAADMSDAARLLSPPGGVDLDFVHPQKVVLADLEYTTKLYAGLLLCYSSYIWVPIVCLTHKPLADAIESRPMVFAVVLAFAVALALYRAAVHSWNNYGKEEKKNSHGLDHIFTKGKGVLRFVYLILAVSSLAYINTYMTIRFVWPFLLVVHSVALLSFLTVLLFATFDFSFSVRSPFVLFVLLGFSSFALIFMDSLTVTDDRVNFSITMAVVIFAHVFYIWHSLGSFSKRFQWRSGGNPLAVVSDEHERHSIGYFIPVETADVMLSPISFVVRFLALLVSNVKCCRTVCKNLRKGSSGEHNDGAPQVDAAET